jgi:hypothetical protein
MVLYLENLTGLFKKVGAKIKPCGESGKNGNRSITEGNEGERLQVRACVCMRMELLMATASGAVRTRWRH